MIGVQKMFPHFPGTYYDQGHGLRVQIQQQLRATWNKYSGVIEDHPNHGHIHYLKAIHSALSGLNKFFHNLYNAHLWMRRPEAKHTAQHGRAVLENYLRAASHALRLKFTKFKLIPKHHMLCHVIRVLEQSSVNQKWTLSPVASMCQQDEDLVGRVSALSRACDIRTVHERTLRKYLVKVQLLLTAKVRAHEEAPQIAPPLGKWRRETSRSHDFFFVFKN